MKSHFLVRSKTGRLQPSQLAFCRKILMASVPYSAASCVVWESLDGGSAMISSSNEGLEMPNRLQHPLGIDWVYGFTGREPTQGLPQELLLPKRQSSAQMNRFVNETAGQFSVLGMNLHSGEFFGTTPLSRAQTLYFAESESLLVLGTSAISTHLLASEREAPLYDLESIPLFVMNGFFVSDDTAFVGCKAVPLGSTLVVNSDNSIEVESINLIGLYESRRTLTPTQIEQQLEEFSESLVEYFAGIATSIGNPTIALTGGKDSRMLFAGLLTVGKPINAFTVDRGLQSVGDLHVAPQIVELFAATHQIEYEVRHELGKKENESESVTCTQLDQYLRETLKYSDAQLTLREWILPVREKYIPRLQGFSGSGGEQLRGGYNASNPGTIAQLLRLFSPSTELWQPFAVASARQRLEVWFERHSELSESEIGDLIHLEFRMGRWASGFQYRSAMTGLPTAPYLDNKIVSTMLKIPVAERTNDKANYHFVNRVSPELAELPFAGDKWRFKSGNDAASQEALLAQLQSKFSSRSAPLYELGWRSQFFRDNPDYFESSLLNNGAFSELLVADEVRKMMRRVEPPPRIAVFYNLMTGAMLLRDSWWQ